MARGPRELLAGDQHPDALSIADLYDEVEGAIARVFPRRRSLWVRGEIQKITDQRAGRGHCYLDLVDPESSRQRQAPVLRVKCWETTWAPIRATLAREGIVLQPGMVVVLRGSLDFYRPKAEIGFVMAELDVTTLLGRLAAQRAALLRALETEGLLARNGSLQLGPVPLRVGLVGSPGTEGYRDFLGQLSGSGFGFQVHVSRATVQGAAAPGSLSVALRRLSGLGSASLDLIVVVRGGGSKADLAAFDSPPVARAIATSPVPVWTGIGHTGDESVADVVANRSFVTPTECGRELVHRVSSWWGHAVDAAAITARRAADALAVSHRSHDDTRNRLCAMARHLLARQEEHVGQHVATISRCAPRVVEDARSLVIAHGPRLSPLALHHVARAEERLAAWRRLLAAYDVERQLERGYTLTLGVDGRVVRHAAAVHEGSALVTRFADGAARSTVTAVERTGPAGSHGSWLGAFATGAGGTGHSDQSEEQT